jgi:hypothetical protein
MIAAKIAALPKGSHGSKELTQKQVGTLAQNIRTINCTRQDRSQTRLARARRRQQSRLPQFIATKYFRFNNFKPR